MVAMACSKRERRCSVWVVMKGVKSVRGGMRVGSSCGRIGRWDVHCGVWVRSVVLGERDHVATVYIERMSRRCSRSAGVR